MSKKRRNKPQPEVLKKRSHWLIYTTALFFGPFVLVILIFKSLLWLKNVDGVVVDKQTREFAYVASPGSGGGPRISVTKPTYGTGTKYHLVLKMPEGKIDSVYVPKEVFDKCMVNVSKVKKQKLSFDFQVTEK